MEGTALEIPARAIRTPRSGLSTPSPQTSATISGCPGKFRASFPAVVKDPYRSHDEGSGRRAARTRSNCVDPGSSTNRAASSHPIAVGR